MSAKPVVVIGGGPAGLMAAETIRAAGWPVELYDHMGSVGRKILIAGKGGLNLTHSEEAQAFRARYGERRAAVSRWLDLFDADQLRRWALGLGVETVIGSSGRVFPADFKAAPLLRGWVRRLRSQGVAFRLQHRWVGWDGHGRLCFESPQGCCQVEAAATVLALGGGSWARLGSDGRWTDILARQGLDLAPFEPSNCGFEVAWSEHFRQRHAGQPLKAIAASARPEPESFQRGELMITDYGLEGGLVYALSAALRSALKSPGGACLWLDLYPERSHADLAQALKRPAGRRSLAEQLRRRIGLKGLRAGLLHEVCPQARALGPDELAGQLKALPLPIEMARPIDEAISTAGGVRLDALDDQLMLRALPGVFCAGEMLDWDAPTGGYLLTACLASGKLAGQAAARWSGLDRAAVGSEAEDGHHQGVGGD